MKEGEVIEQIKKVEEIRTGDSDKKRQGTSWTRKKTWLPMHVHLYLITILNL